MKKALLMLAVVAAFSFSSCKKDFTCTCKDGATTIISVPYTDAKKGDAEDACSATEATYRAAYPNVSCSLD